MEARKKNTAKYEESIKRTYDRMGTNCQEYWGSKINFLSISVSVR